jgi:uncharacterized protein (DUF2141 family)
MRKGLDMVSGILTLALMTMQAVASSADPAAANLIVTVTGIKSAEGQIGCGLFRSAEGFPMKSEKAVMRWQPALKGSVVCRFENLAPGQYAVSASHDLNGNKKTDTSFIGLPREDWGVSNNIRPAMRPPRFNEAAFAVEGGRDVQIKIEVDR